MNKISVLLFIFTVVISGQSRFRDFVNYVNSIPDTVLKAAAVDSFVNYAGSSGIPFIEDNTANFIYIGYADEVSVAGDFNGWNPNEAEMDRLNGTVFWYFTKAFELNVRLDYKIVINGNEWILDSENPNTCIGGFGANSELAMPEYIQPWEINYNNNIEHGKVEEKNLFSLNTNSDYQIKIYLPPGYDNKSSERYPAVYFQDGYDYIDAGYAINIIDNLTDSNKIEKVIAVFVNPASRNEEYALSKRNQYMLFFINELVPFIDSLYRTIPVPMKRGVIGDSYGGNISALISLYYPDVFANCGLHSGALFPNNNEALNLIINEPKKDIKFYLVQGTYELPVIDMREFRDALLSGGYEFKWLGLPEGHSWGLWRATIDEMLEYFFPESPSEQKYPNPYNPETKIKHQ
jgi:enterochelin esterase-like enzyme